MTARRKGAAPGPMSRRMIGWSERVDLPEWGITGLTAKIDTGARTSALHVHHVERRPRKRVRFDVVVSHRRSRRLVPVEARITRIGRVRSSSGDYTTRLFTATRVRVGDVERIVEMSLVDRTEMIHRMLLGRTALRGFLVDPTRTRLLS